MIDACCCLDLLMSRPALWAYAFYVRSQQPSSQAMSALLPTLPPRELLPTSCPLLLCCSLLLRLRLRATAAVVNAAVVNAATASTPNIFTQANIFTRAMYALLPHSLAMRALSPTSCPLLLCCCSAAALLLCCSILRLRCSALCS
jgi:hypothetical protein